MSQPEKIQKYHVLLAKLKDRNGDTRYWAVQALGELGDIRAVPELIYLLQVDSSKNVWGESVQEAAAKALGILGDKSAFDPLVQSFNNGNLYVRSAAITGLGLLGDKRAFELLVNILKDKSESARDEAAKALSNLNDLRAVEPLIYALRDEDHYVRREAAEGLKRFKSKRVIQALITALNDQDVYVRYYSAETLGEFGDATAIPALNLVKQVDEGQLVNGEKVKDAATEAIRLITYKSL